MVAFQPRGGVLNMARPITLRSARSCCGTHLVAWDIVVLVSMTHSPLTGAARAVAPGSRALRLVTPRTGSARRGAAKVAPWAGTKPSCRTGLPLCSGPERDGFPGRATSDVKLVQDDAETISSRRSPAGRPGPGMSDRIPGAAPPGQIDAAAAGGGQRPRGRGLLRA